MQTQTYLQSTSFPETTSVIIKCTQGGGVMGRRSYTALENVNARKYKGEIRLSGDRGIQSSKVQLPISKGKRPRALNLKVSLRKHLRHVPQNHRPQLGTAICTLSPKPHIRARCGCCTTFSLAMWLAASSHRTRRPDLLVFPAILHE